MDVDLNKVIYKDEDGEPITIEREIIHILDYVNGGEVFDADEDVKKRFLEHIKEYPPEIKAILHYHVMKEIVSGQHITWSNFTEFFGRILN